jgi:hypothetical protein
VAVLVAYACFGLLAVLLASVYAVAGSWGLIAFAVPLLLARQMFTHWRRLVERQLQSKRRTRRCRSWPTVSLTNARTSVSPSRRGYTTRFCLPLQGSPYGSSGPPRPGCRTAPRLGGGCADLLCAVEAADSALRDTILDLRRSAIGPGGLLETLHLLAREAEAGSTVRVQLELVEVGGSPLTQLLLYQLAREALANALKHAEARQIVISLSREGGAIRLRISDDGRGFNPLLVDSANHFGLSLAVSAPSWRGSHGGGHITDEAHCRLSTARRIAQKADPSKGLGGNVVVVE